MLTDTALEPVAFDELAGWSDDDVEAAWPAFLASARAIATDAPVLRVAKAPDHALKAIAAEAVTTKAPSAARAFFMAHFTPHRVRPASGGGGFVTAYYEPCVAGALTRSYDFAAPILSCPNRTDTALPDRAAILAGALEGQARPIVWLQDAVEVFLIQVQGSARVRLPDGQVLRLVYDGRNGWPYTSIGKLLIERGAIEQEAMSLDALKGWLRNNGAGAGGLADDVMRANASYVFFRAESADDNEAGPIGGQGVPLACGRSIAIDRHVWSYGLPVWIDAPLGNGHFRRLTVAQDTGSAIVGPARADLFFGSGDAAGRCAGRVRHPADFVVLLPNRTAP